MKLSVQLDPREEVRIKITHEGETVYSVRAGRQTLSGSVVASDSRQTTGVRVIGVMEGPSGDVVIAAPNPVIIRPNRTMAWSNKSNRTIRIRID